MVGFEYKVVPAPSKGLKAKGIKGAEGRFAYTLETVMNEMAAEGWEFQRSETLPSEERSGFTSTTVNWRNVLVFRRPRQAQVAEVPAPAPAPQPTAPQVAAVEEPKLIVAEVPPKPAAKPNRSGDPEIRAPRVVAASIFDLSDDDVTEIDSLGHVVRNRAAEIRGHEHMIEDAEELDDLWADDFEDPQPPQRNDLAAQ